MMRRFLLPGRLILIVCLALAGCATQSRSTAQPPCPPIQPVLLPSGWELSPAGQYRATRAGDEVIVRATIWDLASTEFLLARSSMSGANPPIVLYRKRAPVRSVAVEQKYEICGRIPAEPQIDQLRIIDRQSPPGGRVIQIEEARETEATTRP